MNITLEHLNFMLFEINRFENKPEIKSTFHENDIRYAFVDYLSPVLRAYYYKCLIHYTNSHPDFSYYNFSINNVELQKNLNELNFLNGNQEFLRELFADSNRSVMTDSWSMFEFTISTICEYILTENDQNHRKNNEYLRPIKKKCKYLFEQAQRYTRNKENDEDFIEFYRVYRNCMHSNFYYHSKDKGDYHYIFDNVKFSFIAGEALQCFKANSSAKEYYFTPEVPFKLVLELFEIFTELIRTIKHEKLIPCPKEPVL